MQLTIIGAGLAGCEAALWLADRGVSVTLYEQKPVRFSPRTKAPALPSLSARTRSRPNGRIRLPACSSSR